eukprot:1158893-Pelagomonas_calceolata.AAC.15
MAQLMRCSSPAHDAAVTRKQQLTCTWCVAVQTGAQLKTLHADLLPFLQPCLVRFLAMLDGPNAGKCKCTAEYIILWTQVYAACRPAPPPAALPGALPGCYAQQP